MKGIAILASVAVLAALALPGMSSGQSSALPTLDVAVGGGTITVTGAPQSGAVTVRITNSGKPAGVFLVRLNDGVTADEFVAAVPRIRDPNDIERYGSIRFDAGAGPGTSSIDTVLPAGDYVALETSGRDPSKFPHASFTVPRAATEASLPAAKATVSTIDFAFRGPKSIERGSVVRFQQRGHVVHMMLAARVRNAFVAKRVTRLLRAGKDRQAQKLVRGVEIFMDAASPDAVHQQRVTARPGNYVLACFIGTQDRRAHTRLGMARRLRITK